MAATGVWWWTGRTLKMDSSTDVARCRRHLACATQMRPEKKRTIAALKAKVSNGVLKLISLVGDIGGEGWEPREASEEE